MGFEEQDEGQEIPGSIFDAFEGTDDSHDAAPYNTVEIEVDSEGNSEQVPSPPSYDTQQKAQGVEPFSAEKVSPSSMMKGNGRGGSGPNQLNKKFILSIIAGVFCLFIVIATFIVPLFGGKKKEREEKQKVQPVSVTDYARLVPEKRPDTIPQEQGYPETELSDDEILETLPPVNPKYQYEPPAAESAPVTPAGGGQSFGSVSQRPDTKGDRIQGKNISGIKGLTGTQPNYSGQVPGYAGTPASDNPYARFGMPSKDEYTASLLSQYGQQSGASAGGLSAGSGNSYAAQNDQSGKQQFHTAGRDGAGGGMFLSPNTLWQGTIFEATLSSNINTDLPGEVTAWVTKNIYSSLDGKYLLIPQNSRLFGTYNSSISYSQKRVQVGWHTLIRPDGYAVSLGNMSATDAKGASGIPGFLNDHPFQYIKALALMSVFNIISAEFENNIASNQNQYVQNIMANSQEIANTLGSKLIDRAMDVQPTITIKAGTKINIVTNTHLVLPVLEPYEVTMPYHK